MASRKIEVQIVGDSRQLERTFGRAGRSAQGFAGNVSTASRNVARGLAAAGAAVTGLGIVTSKAFSSFETTLSQTVGLAGDSRKAVEGFSKEILRLGPEVAKSPQELAEALYFVASAGVAVQDQMAVVTAAAKASAAGLGETQQVADAVTSAMNAYGSSVLDASEATDVLVNTVKFGKGEAASFAPVIGQVAALAAQLGVRFEEVGAALAAQTRLGTSAETAAVQLQATFSSLLKVTPQQAKALEAVGLNAETLRKQLREQGLLSVLETLKASFGDNTAAMAQAFPNIRALRGLLSLVGQSADSTRKVFDGMKDSTGALGTAFDAVSEDEAFRFKQTLAALQATGIRLGAIFAPVANVIARGTNAALGVVNDFLDRLGDARTIQAKLAVVWEGVEDATKGAQDLLGRAIAGVDFKAVFAEARGIADGLQARLEEVDFTIIGDQIGDAIVAAVRVAIPAAKELAQRVNAAMREIDFEELGRQLGPALATALVTAFATLMDPSFWVRNWDLTLAVALTAFGGPIGRLAGKLAGPLVRLGRGFIERIGLGLIDAFPRLSQFVFDNFSRLLPLVGKALAPLTRLASRVFGRLGRLASFVVKVLGITAAINVISRFASRVGGVFSGIATSIKDWFKRAMTAVRREALETALFIIKKLDFTILGVHIIPGVHGLVKDIQGELDKIAASAEDAMARTQGAIDRLHGKTVFVTIDERRAITGSGSAARTTEAETRTPQSSRVPPAVQRQVDSLKNTVASLKQQVSSLTAALAAATKNAAGASKENKTSADASKEASEASRKAAQEARSAAEAAARRFADARANAKSLFGQFFQTPTSTTGEPLAALGGTRGRRLVPTGETTTATGLLQVIRAQNASFKQLQSNIATLTRRGAPASLISAIRSGEISPEQARALAKANQPTLAAIFRQIRISDKLVTRAARMEVSAQNVTVRSPRLLVPAGVGRGDRGNAPIIVENRVYLDGKQIATSQQRASKRRANQRTGRAGGHR